MQQPSGHVMSALLWHGRDVHQLFILANQKKNLNLIRTATFFIVNLQNADEKKNVYWKTS